ncbi:stalk domain-containing protein [Paenibacillus sp. YN15]|uniref:stalk domain-containing protein n=1 Tax=Paenibacillus sp. YN15 TaxID=1742774 RepID=UPI000DCD234A|nr:stalk domain-containing protein [Paenibacillus sp. YN15]RAV05449.1 hypothetical protein DQG13_02165 [Paenibacillus sp. YN15]
MARFRRVAALTLAFFLVAGGAAIAGSRWGSYEGYSKVQVNANGTTINSAVPAIMMNGATMLPLRETATALNSFIKWDDGNQTANIYRPNVNMVVSQELDVDKKGAVTGVPKPFFKAPSGYNISFFVFVQMDSLKTTVDGFKISVLDPSGNELDKRVSSESIYDYLWSNAAFNIKFSEAGNYTVRFALKVDGEFVTVGEKLIVSE